MSKILLVEDQSQLSNLVCDMLFAQNYLVDVTGNGSDALLLLKQNDYDLIILDINLPHVSGVDVCRSFRARGGRTPIIFLTINQSIDDKELGFDAGADDYLTKPFNMRELSARIKAVLKRAGGASNDVLQFGELVLDSGAHSVCMGGVPVELQPKEFALLEFLMRHSDRVFSSEALFQRVWPSSSQASADSIRSHITRIRQKLGTEGERIATVHGVGYRFSAK